MAFKQNSKTLQRMKDIITSEGLSQHNDITLKVRPLAIDTYFETNDISHMDTMLQTLSVCRENFTLVAEIQIR